MHSFLLKLDGEVFFLINNLPHNDILNSVNILFSGGGSGILSWFCWVFLGFIFFLYERKKGKVLLLSLVLAGLLTFVINERGLKKIFRRGRPQVQEHNIETISIEIKNLYEPKKSYSFPSGHSTIAFAGAYILGARRKKYKVIFYILAFLTAFSRIYLGKHFPSDVVIGALEGILIGAISIKISLYLLKKISLIEG